MELTKGERQQIRQILQTPQWATVDRLANLLCDKISYSSKVKDTEWETLKTVLTEEGEVRGIKRLIQEMFNQAQYD